MTFETLLGWSRQPEAIRLMVVLGLLFVLLACQHAWPRRGEAPVPGRRRNNILLATVSAVLVLVAVPISTIALAVIVQQNGIGLFQSRLFAQLAWPPMAEFALAIVALDLAIYWQHRMFHQLPWLWRIHRVHHSDMQFEVTLGLRFHPAEILLSLLYKFVLIAVLGAAPIAVATYEVLLAAFALFTHADVAIPPRWDRWLRWLLVTPDWHRVHHSVHRRETDSNYGNLLSVWDRLFASHIAQPTDGHRHMQLGLSDFRTHDAQTLPALLRQPLLRDSSGR